MKTDADEAARAAFVAEHFPPADRWAAKRLLDGGAWRSAQFAAWQQARRAQQKLRDAQRVVARWERQKRRDESAAARLEEQQHADLDAARRAVRAHRRHRVEYCCAVKSEPGEIEGPNSYPVPWMWTDSYRYTPSELSLISLGDDEDFAAWQRDITDRYAHSRVDRKKYWRQRHWNVDERERW